MAIKNSTNSARSSIRDWLSNSSLERIDAESLLCHVLGQSRSYLFAHSGTELTQEQNQILTDLENRRLAGEPLAYITGIAEFWSLTFKVSPDVLIPRDDTGCLVEVGLALLPKLPYAGLIIDAGTGSGAVAIAFAHETGCHVIAIDQSLQALEIAAENAARLTPKLVACRPGNWLEDVTPNSVRLLLSNPPYIPAADPHLSAPELTHEPQSALVAGADGLDDIRALVRDASKVLMPGGAVAIEHGYNQRKAVQKLFKSVGFLQVTTVQDLAGHDRVTHATAP